MTNTLPSPTSISDTDKLLHLKQLLSSSNNQLDSGSALNLKLLSIKLNPISSVRLSPNLRIPSQA